MSSRVAAVPTIAPASLRKGTVDVRTVLRRPSKASMRSSASSDAAPDRSARAIAHSSAAMRWPVSGHQALYSPYRSISTRGASCPQMALPVGFISTSRPVASAINTPTGSKSRMVCRRLRSSSLRVCSWVSEAASPSVSWRACSVSWVSRSALWSARSFWLARMPTMRLVNTYSATPTISSSLVWVQEKWGRKTR